MTRAGSLGTSGTYSGDFAVCVGEQANALFTIDLKLGGSEADVAVATCKHRHMNLGAFQGRQPGDSETTEQVPSPSPSTGPVGSAASSLGFSSVNPNMLCGLQQYGLKFSHPNEF